MPLRDTHQIPAPEEEGIKESRDDLAKTYQPDSFRGHPSEETTRGVRGVVCVVLEFSLLTKAGFVSVLMAVQSTSPRIRMDYSSSRHVGDHWSGPV